MLSSSYPCRVTGELHLFMEFLQVLPKTCPGAPLKWSWDTALLLLLPSEGFTGAAEGDSARLHRQASLRTREFPEPPTELGPRPALGVFTLMRSPASQQQEAVT